MKILLLSLLMSPVFVYANDCTQLVSQLRQMKEAQLAVQSSLIKNHEMVASSLDSYADALKESSGRAHKTVSTSMVTASNSLRKRGEKGQELATKLAEQTELIIINVENCLR